MKNLLTYSSLITLMTCSHALSEPLNFNRISSFPTPTNMVAGEDLKRETSAETIATTRDGMMLLYTDSPLGVVGIIDITDAKAPKPLGNIDVSGEPTSVAIVDNIALVAVNISESFIAPSGKLLAINISTKQIAAECDLGGQPDSIAAAPDGSFVAIAIENERDEDLNDGALPQMPAGSLVMVPLNSGIPQCASLIVSDMTGLAEIAGDDPEPEYVDINALGETAVTFQENNHIVVVGRDGKVINHFSAGMVTLENIDLTDERAALLFDEVQADRKREPDAIKWIDNDHFATANEGDYEGGSRGWTIFHKDGTMVWDAGMSFENAVVEMGHYPDRRSDAKGAEPETVAFATYGGVPYVFVAAERASVIGVYDVSNPASPVLKQMLPSGVSPEGIATIPNRNLLASANEVDFVEDGGVRSHVMIYEASTAPVQYPTLTSNGADSLIGWGALSGLASDAAKPGRVFAVNDSFYGFQPRIFEIDVTQIPARIVAATDITREGRIAQKLDIEGITSDGEGGFWLASEGRTDRVIPHALYHVNSKGDIKEEIGLPAELLAHEVRFGFEGIAKIGDTLWMPVQREWGDDPKGFVKLVAYNTSSKEWGAVHYPLDSPSEGAWMGLSEIAIHGDHAYFIERDNKAGADAATKNITRVALSEMVPVALGGTLPVVKKELVRDLLPDLAGFHGYIAEKVEGLTFDAAGKAFIVTDNDGVDDSSGETFFMTMDGLTK